MMRRKNRLFFPLSLAFCMHNNNMWYCWNNCPLSNLGANSPQGWLRHLNSSAAGFVGIFLTWKLSWSSHWCSSEQKQVLRQPYADFQSRNSSLLLINHSGFLCWVHISANFHYHKMLPFTLKCVKPLWETQFRFTEVAKKKIKIIIKISFLVYFLFPFSFLFFSLDAGLKAYFCTWITLEPDSSLKAHQMLMPWGTWQHTSASFKILTTPFLKAIFIILRLYPCIEAIPVLTSLWEAVRLSRTFCLWASIRFFWVFFFCCFSSSSCTPADF